MTWDSVRWDLVSLLPRFVCVWLWECVELGNWAPFVLGRVVERRPTKVTETKGIHHD